MGSGFWKYSFIGKMGSEAVGYIVDNFGKMTTMTNVLTEMTIGLLTGSFSIRLRLLSMLLSRHVPGKNGPWPYNSFVYAGSDTCPVYLHMVWIAIFGGQVIYLQTSGTFDVWNAVNTYGMQATVFQIIGTLPLSKFITIMFLLCIVMSFSLWPTQWHPALQHCPAASWTLR